MNTFKLHLICIVVLFLFGCVMMSSTPVTVNSLTNIEKGKKEVTFLNQTLYIADLSIALAENGFVVKPMPTQMQITEIQSSTRTANYKEASTRWGISLQTQDSGMKCAFTDFDIHHFTLMLTDIATNQVVLVLKQQGSDGPCTTVEPVFGTLAKALADNW